MNQPGHLPSADRLSVITAILFLVYALASLVNLPVQEINFQVFGSVYPLQLNLASIVAFMVAILAGLGADWLLRGHPGLKKQSTTQYLLIPALTAWVLGVTLNTLRLSPQWWLLFALGMLLLVVVYTAEYIIVDLSDIRHIPAVMVLIAVSFALFLILATAVDASNARLYVLFPAVVTAMFLVSLRTLYLRLDGRWCFAWSIAAALIVGQIALGLHYLPIGSLTFGLILAGSGYALTSLAAGIESQSKGIQLWLEPGAMFTLIAVLALVLL